VCSSDLIDIARPRAANSSAAFSKKFEGGSVRRGIDLCRRDEMILRFRLRLVF